MKWLERWLFAGVVKAEIRVTRRDDGRLMSTTVLTNAREKQVAELVALLIEKQFEVSVTLLNRGQLAPIDEVAPATEPRL